jgi:hypothetical protein
MDHSPCGDPRGHNNGRYPDPLTVETEPIAGRDTVRTWYVRLRWRYVVVETTVLVVRKDERHFVPVCGGTEILVDGFVEALSFRYGRVWMLPRGRGFVGGHTGLEEGKLMERSFLDVLKELVHGIDILVIFWKMHVLKIHNSPGIILIVRLPGNTMFSQKIKITLLSPKGPIKIVNSPIRSARHQKRTVGVRRTR